MKVNAKYVVFSAIAAASVYVLYHNERFLVQADHPAWQHYAPFKWWLLPHGIFGAIVIVSQRVAYAVDSWMHEPVHQRITAANACSGHG